MTLPLRSILPLALLFITPTLGVAAKIEISLKDGRILRGTALGDCSPDECEFAGTKPGISISRRLSWDEIRSVRIEEQEWTAAELQAWFVVQNADSPAEDIEQSRPENSLVANTSFAPSSLVPPPGPIQAGGPQWIPPTCDPLFLTPPLPIEGRVIGVRPDPLLAYEPELSSHFPLGVPVNERGFVRELMRARAFSRLPLITPAVPIAPFEPAPVLPEPEAISIQATPVSVHGRVDRDALQVHIIATDRLGRPASVQGTLQFVLWGQRQELVRSRGTELAPSLGKVVELGRWTRSFDSRILSESRVWSQTGGPHLLLPLGNANLAQNTEIAPFAQLHVRLIAPGHGTLETTTSPFSLREDSPLRRRQFVERGTPFLPSERTWAGRPRATPFVTPSSLPRTRPEPLVVP